MLIWQTDNHMINGTKLLNVAGMTRGRRDGILKSEKQKHVVKIGPMHLKGVWFVSLPFFHLFLQFFVSNLKAILTEFVQIGSHSNALSNLPTKRKSPNTYIHSSSITSEPYYTTL